MKFAKISLMAVLAFTVSANTFARIQPIADGSFEMVDRHLSGFSAIDAGGSFDVYITQGAVESVKVDAPANMLDYIITEVKNGVLILHNKNDHWHWSGVMGSHHHIAVYVTAKNLSAISATGSGDVSFKNVISSNVLKLDLSGSGDMSGKLNVKTLQSTLSGSGDLQILGNAGNQMVEMSGSGDYHAGDVRSANAAIRISGSGDAYLNVSNKLDASSSGSGDIRYTGAVRNVSRSKSGSGDIERD